MNCRSVVPTESCRTLGWDIRATIKSDYQFGNRPAVIDDRSRAAVEVFDEDLRGVDSQVVIDRRQEIACPTVTFDHVFAPFVCRSDEASRFDSASCPNVAESSRPMVTPGLFGASRGTRVSDSRARLIIDLWCPSKLAGDDDQHAFVKTTLVDIFNQSGDRLVVHLSSKSQGIKDVMVHGVVVPVVDATAQRTTKTGGQDFHTRFDQSACQQQLLPPAVASITISRSIILLAQVECVFGSRVRQQRQCLGLELVERVELAMDIECALQVIEVLATAPRADPIARFLVDRRDQCWALKNSLRWDRRSLRRANRRPPNMLARCKLSEG